MAQYCFEMWTAGSADYKDEVLQTIIQDENLHLPANHLNGEAAEARECVMDYLIAMCRYDVASITLARAVVIFDRIVCEKPEMKHKFVVYAYVALLIASKLDDDYLRVGVSFLISEAHRISLRVQRDELLSEEVRFMKYLGWNLRTLTAVEVIHQLLEDTDPNLKHAIGMVECSYFAANLVCHPPTLIAYGALSNCTWLFTKDQMDSFYHRLNIYAREDEARQVIDKIRVIKERFSPTSLSDVEYMNGISTGDSDAWEEIDDSDAGEEVQSDDQDATMLGEAVTREPTPTEPETRKSLSKRIDQLFCPEVYCHSSERWLNEETMEVESSVEESASASSENIFNSQLKVPALRTGTWPSFVEDVENDLEFTLPQDDCCAQNLSMSKIEANNNNNDYVTGLLSQRSCSWPSLWFGSDLSASENDTIVEASSMDSVLRNARQQEQSNRTIGVKKSGVRSTLNFSEKDGIRLQDGCETKIWDSLIESEKMDESSSFHDIPLTIENAYPSVA
eukprot:CFRG8198T1